MEGPRSIQNGALGVHFFGSGLLAGRATGSENICLLVQPKTMKLKKISEKKSRGGRGGDQKEGGERTRRSAKRRRSKGLEQRNDEEAGLKAQN